MTSKDTAAKYVDYVVDKAVTGSSFVYATTSEDPQRESPAQISERHAPHEP
jgi:hypothetical protein